MKSKIKTPVAKDPKVVYSILKLTMGLYRLIKITMKSDGTYEITKIHEDVPPIVYGKLLALIQSQEFGNHD